MNTYGCGQEHVVQALNTNCIESRDSIQDKIMKNKDDNDHDSKSKSYTDTDNDNDNNNNTVEPTVSDHPNSNSRCSLTGGGRLRELTPY